MRGSEIVRQLMIYAGKESAVVELVDLSKTVDEMLSLLKVSVTKHAVIEADLDQDLPAIRASAAQLRQIVMNLITNASDAIGDRDGVIRVITRRVTLKGESAAIDPERCRTAITCNWRSPTPVAACPPKRRPRCSTRSSPPNPRAADSGSLSCRGSCGVSAERSILRANRTKALHFKYCCHVRKTTAGASGHAMSGDGEMAVPAQHGTVLVVEDEGHLRQAVVKMLRKTGFEVFEAADGSSAIDLLRADGDKIDVILLDMTIPGASSHEIVAQAANAKPDIKSDFDQRL